MSSTPLEDFGNHLHKLICLTSQVAMEVEAMKPFLEELNPRFRIISIRVNMLGHLYITVTRRGGYFNEEKILGGSSLQHDLELWKSIE